MFSLLINEINYGNSTVYRWVNKSICLMFFLLYFGFINKLFSNLIITPDKKIQCIHFRTCRKINLLVLWTSSFIFLNSNTDTNALANQPYTCCHNFFCEKWNPCLRNFWKKKKQCKQKPLRVVHLHVWYENKLWTWEMLWVSNSMLVGC